MPILESEIDTLSEQYAVIDLINGRCRNMFFGCHNYFSVN